MLETFVEQLAKDLDIKESITNPEPGRFNIAFDNDIKVDAFQSTQGNYAFKSTIGPPPKQNVHEFYLKTMDANLFGRGTMGSSIGLNEETNTLTLSHEVDSNHSYKDWRDKLEDFVNIIDFWKKEILNHH